jgi:CheY-like chemotaxis protein
MHYASPAAGGAKVIVIVDPGDIPPAGARTVTRPLHSILVANILNGIPDTGLREDETEKKPAFFTAPDARVLVVDDMSTNLRVAAGFVSQYGVRTDTASSGEEAARKAIASVEEHSPYDLILMDHMMPGVDGIASLKKIRQYEAARNAAPMPIVVLTANAMSGMREMFIAQGFDGYLSKPIELAKLNDIMERWIPVEKRRK